MSDESDSDVDYVPSDGEAVSEEEASGDDESWLKNEADDDPVAIIAAGVKRKKGKTKAQPKSRKRKGGIKLDDGGAVVEKEPVVDVENERLKEKIIEEEKSAKEGKEAQRKEDLWSIFLSDVGQRPKTNVTNSSQVSKADATKASDTLPSDTLPSDTLPSDTVPNNSRPPDKLSVMKTYNFAGETIKVTELVDAGSKQGKEELKRLQDTTTGSSFAAAPTVEATASTSLTAPSSVQKRTGGLSGVLGKMDKTAKISCLDKSKVDWDVFKSKEGIEEELSTHNKGKQGYIERLDFLGRADQRQFQIERDLRQSSRKYLP